MKKISDVRKRARTYDVEVEEVDPQLGDLLLDLLDEHWTIHALIDEVWESRTGNVRQIVLHLPTAAPGNLLDINNIWECWSSTRQLEE